MLLTPLLVSARQLVFGDDGADAVEYSLLASLIAIALIVGAGALGFRINDVFFGLTSCDKPGNGVGPGYGNPNTKCGPFAKY